MIRTLAALVVAASGLALLWFAIWGVIVTGWMPDATAEDMAWRFTVGLLSLAIGAGGLAVIGLAGVVLAPVVRSVYEAATK